jgi:hypothetical protein
MKNSLSLDELVKKAKEIDENGTKIGKPVEMTDKPDYYDRLLDRSKKHIQKSAIA